MFSSKKKEPIEERNKAIFEACEEKNVKRVAKLLKDNSTLVNSLDSEGRTPLHIACSSSSIAIVQLLLQNNAEVNVQDSRGWTPLHQVAYNKDENLLLLLLEQPRIKGKFCFL
jgi:ankyrin repeat protein